MIFPQEQLNTLLSFVLNNEHSSFYRDHFKRSDCEISNVDSKKAWEQIPTLTRADLECEPNPDARAFVPEEDRVILRHTSGTSTQNPLFLWRSYFSSEIYSLYHHHGARKCLAFYPQYQNGIALILPAHKAGIQTLIGDPRDLPHALTLIKQESIDTLMLTPTLAFGLMRYKSATALFKNIHVVGIWGEYCSRETWKTLQDIFPNATLIYEYALSESNGNVGVTTSMCREAHNTFHVTPNHVYLECIDDELVITTLPTPFAMPLIRYKTGDLGEWVDEACTCGNADPRFRVFGRREGDVAKVGGGELRIEEVERALTPIHPFIFPHYHIEVSESIEKGVRKVLLTLCVEAREKKDTHALHNNLLQAFNDVRISGNMTLGNAVSAGLFYPPQIRFLTQNETGAHKTKRIVRR